MKKQILVLLTLIISTLTYAQKSELKSVEKALKSGKTSEAQTALNAAEPLVANADAKTKARFQLLKGKLNYELAKKGNDNAYDTALDAFQEVVTIEESGKKTYTVEAKQLMQAIGTDFVNQAIKANEQRNFGVASKKLYGAYKLNKTNQDYLYFAANSAVSDKNYENALKYYLELKEIGYTGVKTEFYATNVDTGVEDVLPSKEQRDLYVKAKTHRDPGQRQTKSKLPEIVKNIALIYTQNGENEKALAAIEEARAKNPNDSGLLITHANLYYQTGQKDKYKELIEEAIRKNPNDPVLYFNLGVANSEQGNNEEAKKYYEKAVAVDPNHKESYLNLASIILSEEETIVNEMNGLGTSRADNARYDVLKVKREDLYKSAVPYLEKILNIDAKNVQALKTLMNIYGTLGDTDKFRELKGKLAELEQ